MVESLVKRESRESHFRVGLSAFQRGSKRNFWVTKRGSFVYEQRNEGVCCFLVLVSERCREYMQKGRGLVCFLFAREKEMRELPL